ncbi:MAG: glycosyltransferase [Planctomycetota bacterium]
MRIHYATNYFSDGNAFGYSVHNAEARASLVRAGVVLDASAPVAFHVASPLVFRPVPGKKNVLYVAWETDRLPEDYAGRIRGADVLIVTAEFLRPVFQRALPGRPVHVAHLGVRAERYPFARRTLDRRRPFRFLWVGAPNARKGFELLLHAWEYFARRADVELYLKTTVTGRLQRVGNVVFDARRLPRAELAALYAGAHAFVLPSFGEGFGLTLAEAMATGLPALFTDWSALAEVANAACGYPLPYEMIETPLGRMAQCDLAALVVGMERVRREYGKALRKGRRASERIRRVFTWDRAAERILDALRAEGLFEAPPVSGRETGARGVPPPRPRRRAAAPALA